MSASTVIVVDNDDLIKVEPARTLLTLDAADDLRVALTEALR